MALIYKITPREEWEAAVAAGTFAGSPVDLADGFIHFSTAEQTAETLARHFAGQRDLLLVAFDETTLGDKLTYEPSRGGQLFPHLYAPLDPKHAVWVRAIADRDDGSHALPDLGS